MEFLECAYTEDKVMDSKKIITYGTWDMFHYGHYFLLKRAKKLGGQLYVGVSTDKMCLLKGKATILDENTRLQLIKEFRFVDKVFFEYDMKQKVDDIEKYGIDIFVLGDDYAEKFPQMEEYAFVKEKCEIIYLPRTPEISATDLKNKLANQMNIKKIM